MSDLVVRAYNVGFGDAVLVSIPEDEGRRHDVVRHLLIDVGNLVAGEANEDGVFTTVVADIAAKTGGEVDLYVMTHEHMDHVQGLLAARKAGHPLAAKYAWLTSSAATDYYERHPNAHKERLDDQSRLTDVLAQQDVGSDPWLALMIRNNAALLPDGALDLTTSSYVDHVRTVAPPDKTFYVDRSSSLNDKHPFTEAKLRILAPESDTSTYYGRRKKNKTFTASEAVGVASAGNPDEPVVATGMLVPPVGVDAGSFFDLVNSRHQLNRETILEIDAAANNTSLVLEIEWRGWTLLFPGDAEGRSWLTMKENELLRPVHFIKVSHHGSMNGTEPSVIEDLMPLVAPDQRERRAVVSTHEDDWDSVPDPPTLDLYRRRCTLLDTRTVSRGEAVEIVFAG